MIRDIQPPDPATAAKLRAEFLGDPIVDIAEYGVRQFADVKHYLPEIRPILAASLMPYWYDYPERANAQFSASLARSVWVRQQPLWGRALRDPRSRVRTHDAADARGRPRDAGCLLCLRAVHLVDKPDRAGPGSTGNRAL
jgi:hypothetical protein